MRIILTREGIFHPGILSPVFKNKKEDPSLLQQQRSSYHWQLVRNCHDLELSFSSSDKLLLKTTLPVSSYNLNKS